MIDILLFFHCYRYLVHVRKHCLGPGWWDEKKIMIKIEEEMRIGTKFSTDNYLDLISEIQILLEWSVAGLTCKYGSQL